jgi:hypothetical protein
MTLNFALIYQIHDFGSGQILQPRQIYLSPGPAKIAPWWLARRDYFPAKVPGLVSADGATNVYSLNRRAVMGNSADHVTVTLTISPSLTVHFYLDNSVISAKAYNGLIYHIMKKMILLIIFIAFSQMIQSQDKVDVANMGSKNLIGLYSNIGVNQPFRFKNLSENDWFHGKEFFSLGLHYHKTLSQRLKLDVGINYSKYKVKIEAPDDWTGPSITPFSESFAMITVPIQIRLYSLKNYFLSFGSLIDFDLARKSDWPFTDTQSGLGLSLGVGKELIINKFSFDIIPNIAIHSLIPFKSENYQQRLFEIGLKIGINYKIN